VKWLLDTNVVSETIARRPNVNVTNWLNRHPADEMTVSIVTLAEIRDGISSAPELRRRELSPWFDTAVMPSLGDRALPLTLDILIDWIGLCRALAAERMMRRAADLLIAATARVHELTIVTRNVRHFAETGVIVYDPWNDKTHRTDMP
jgi:predicted nucleic acid-binding protein